MKCVWRSSIRAPPGLAAPVPVVLPPPGLAKSEGAARVLLTSGSVLSERVSLLSLEFSCVRVRRRSRPASDACEWRSNMGKTEKKGEGAWSGSAWKSYHKKQTRVQSGSMHVKTEAVPQARRERTRAARDRGAV